MRPTPTRWLLPYRTVCVIALVTLLFGGITALRFSDYVALNDGIGYAYVLPIVIASLELGVGWGLVVALLASGATGVWVNHAGAQFTAMAYATRGIGFLTMALVPGILRMSIARQEQRFREHAEVTADLLCVVQPGGLVTPLNPLRWQDLLGYPAPVLATLPMPQLLHPDDRAGGWPLEQHATHRGAPAALSWEARFRHADGSYVWLEWTARRGADGTTCSVARDCTDRKRVEQAGVDLVRFLGSARQEDNRRVAGEVHDLVMQGMLAVLMYCDQLKLSDIGDEARGLLETQRRITMDTVRAARRIMEESRPLQHEHADVGTLVSQSAATLATHWGVHIATRIELERQVDDPDVKLLVQQLAAEAITNACKHAVPDAVAVRLIGDDQVIEVVVADDGRGFDTIVDSAGQPLPELAPATNALLERVVSHGGSWHITSEPGNGTTVRATLPITPIAPVAAVPGAVDA